MSAPELICPECETVVDGTKDGIIIFMSLCPNCLRKGKSVGVVSFRQYDAEKYYVELAKRMFCHTCRYIGLVEEFPVNGKEGKRHCHRCHSDNVVSMTEVTMCGICDAMPVAKNDTVCEHCTVPDDPDELRAQVIEVTVCEKCGQGCAVEGDDWCRRCISAESKEKHKRKKSVW